MTVTLFPNHEKQNLQLNRRKIELETLQDRQEKNVKNGWSVFGKKKQQLKSVERTIWYLEGFIQSLRSLQHSDNDTIYQRDTQRLYSIKSQLEKELETLDKRNELLGEEHSATLDELSNVLLEIKRIDNNNTTYPKSQRGINHLSESTESQRNKCESCGCIPNYNDYCLCNK
jgi:hypothetical protein